MLSNTKVNTLRVTWTRENVTFANACYNGNGRDLAPASRRSPTRTSPTSRTTPAQFRINDGISIDDTLAWFLPGKRGDHDIKVGVQYVYSGASNENQGNLNGTFSFGQNDVDFDPANPRTYPDRFTIRVGGPSSFYEKATYFSGFAQDKWRLTPRLTLSLGLRYDLEVDPDRRDRRSAGRRPIRSTRTTSSRASASPTTSAAARASSAAATAASSTRRTSS